MDREIQAIAGYDYRDDRNDKRGCHGLGFRFILRGPLGAVTWVLNTGLMANAVDDFGWSIYSGRPPRRSGKPGTDRTGSGLTWPTAGPIASHSPVQRRDYWTQGDCDLWDGPCWGDIGYMVGDDALVALATGGSDGVFDFLQTIHDEWLITEPTP